MHVSKTDFCPPGIALQSAACFIHVFRNVITYIEGVGGSCPVCGAANTFVKKRVQTVQTFRIFRPNGVVYRSYIVYTVLYLFFLFSFYLLLSSTSTSSRASSLSPWMVSLPVSYPLLLLRSFYHPIRTDCARDPASLRPNIPFISTLTFPVVRPRFGYFVRPNIVRVYAGVCNCIVNKAHPGTGSYPTQQIDSGPPPPSAVRFPTVPVP